MSTKPRCVEDAVGQAGFGERLSARKAFGDYASYVDERALRSCAATAGSAMRRARRRYEAILMTSVLWYAAVFFFTVKIASTVWLARQPDATVVTLHWRGHAIYLASKFSAILFVASMLARTCIDGAPPAYIAFWAALLVIATAMAVVVIRQRRSGQWYGYAHAMRQRMRNRRDRRQR